MRMTLCLSKKLRKSEGQFALYKDILGFQFDGNSGQHTMQLDEPKREFLLVQLQKWIRTAERKGGKISYAEFESVMMKVRHAFMSVPEGYGLLSPIWKVLRIEPHPTWIWINRTQELKQAIIDAE